MAYLRVAYILEVTGDGSVKTRSDQCIESETLNFSAGCPAGYEDLAGHVGLTPPPCNAHSHLLDYALADLGEHLKIGDLVALPRGLKYKVLREIDDETITDRLEQLASLLIAEHGTTGVAGYAELGDRGVRLLKKGLSRVKWLDLYPQPETPSIEEYIALLERYGRVGLDTLRAVNVEDVERMYRAAKRVNGVIQVHVSETKKLYDAKDYEKAVVLGEHGVVVHATMLKREELKYVAESTRGVVFCPSSNLYHTGVHPPILDAYRVLWRNGFTNLALGTDNAAWGEPSILAEARLAYLSAHHGIVEDPLLGESDAEGIAAMLLYMLSRGCWELLGAPAEDLGRGFLLVKLPEAKWSASIPISLVKRGAFRQKRLMV